MMLAWLTISKPAWAKADMIAGGALNSG
jgi:hypothetical protein